MFIAANHKQGHVNLYLSDETGQFYTLSLEDVAAIQLSQGFGADLYEVLMAQSCRYYDVCVTALDPANAQLVVLVTIKPFHMIIARIAGGWFARCVHC